MVKEKIPVELKNAIINDDLVIFVGAGLSFNLLNSKNEPLKGWKNLVYNIIQNFQEKGYEVSHLKPLIDLYEPIEVLNLIEKDKNLPKSEIYKYVKTFFELNEENNLELHKKLFTISKKIVTTNYDTAFEEAIPKFRRHKAYKGKNYELTTHRNKETPLLFKLHGCFEDAESMVLFPSNYKNLYENSETDAEHSLLVLKNLIFNKTILFIGVGMGDFQINNIFKEVQKLQREFNQKHFIITNKSIDSTLNFVTTINYSQHSEIENLIDVLLEIKKQAEEESPEGMLRKQYEEAQKRLDEVNVEKYEEILSEKDRLLKRESIKHFMKGIEFSLSEEHQQAIEAYECSVELNPYFHEAFYNLGVELGNLARIATVKDSEILYIKAFEKYQKTTELKPDFHEAFYNWAVELGNLARIKEGIESEILYKQAFEKYQKVQEITPDEIKAIFNWGVDLANLAHTKQGDDSDDLYRQAFDKFQNTINLNPDFHESYNQWGIELGKLAETKEGTEFDDYYQEAFEKFQQAIDIKADKYEAFYNWGITLANLAQRKKGKEYSDLLLLAITKMEMVITIKSDHHEAYNNMGVFASNLAQINEGKKAKELYQLAFEQFQRAIDIKFDKAEACYNWAITLGLFAKSKEGKEHEELLFEAIEKLQMVINIKSDNLEAFNTMGVYLGILAQTKESDEIYNQAYEKFQLALDIEPKMYQTFFFWGTVLGNQAKLKEGNESDQLYNQAFEKFQLAININPNSHEVMNNWGTILGYFAVSRLDNKLYEQAIEKLKKAIELGANAYNLSSVYAIKGERENAFFYLKQCLSNKQIKVEYVEKDLDWASYLEDPEFKEILANYRT